MSIVLMEFHGVHICACADQQLAGQMSIVMGLEGLRTHLSMRALVTNAGAKRAIKTGFCMDSRLFGLQLLCVVPVFPVLTSDPASSD